MPHLINRLNESEVRNLRDPGLHPDGRGLYLQVRNSGARSWIFRFTQKGRTRDKGLGPLATVSLVQARSSAAECRAQVARGVDPIEQAKAPAAPLEGPTFEQAAELYMNDKLKHLRNENHRHQWRMTLRTYAYPIIGHKAIGAIDTKDVLAVVRPIWEEKCETASRLRGRIERIIARAIVEGDRVDATNPAAWRGHLQEALAPRSEVRPVVHHAAMDYAAIPAFIIALRRQEGVAARALEFLILTAARTGEVTGMGSAEVDFQTSIWTVPKQRMKSGREHIVPLSTGAVEILRQMQAGENISGGATFPGYKGQGLSQMALLTLLQRRMGRCVTVHGFRSTFRDWVEDEGHFPGALAEAALAHVVRDATERSYRRRTAVERRRAMMQAWCDFCCSSVDETTKPCRPPVEA